MIGGVKILQVLAVFAALCFGVKFSDFLKNLAASGSIAAYAADAAETEPASGAAPPSQNELKTSSEKPDLPEPPREDAPKEKIVAPVAKDSKDAKAETKTTGKENWKGAEDLDDEYADVKLELFEDLSKRRKDLDSREKELVMREALLKATQAEIEQKTKELTTLKTDIETLLKKQTEQEDKRIASLVKIYEGMKAKDAARIFDTLDQDVLIQVVTKMSERKTAPILAAMNADKARSLTIMLAEQNKLPSMPNLTEQ